MRHLPNFICLIRVALIWPIATALAARDYQLALWFFGAAAVSDGLDGYLAKRFNWTSELGKVLDPLADKMLLVTVFVELAWLDVIPWWLSATVVARDVMIGLGALTYRVWFGPLRGRPTVLSKINTAVQLLYVLLVTLNGAKPDLPLHDVLTAGVALTLITTLLSGLHYIVSFTRRAWTPARST